MLRMLPFAVVLLCIVVGVFCQESLPPPEILKDFEGNEFKIGISRDSMELYNSNGGLVLDILSEDGWCVVKYPDRGVCVIVDHEELLDLCYKEVLYNSVVSSNVVEAFCKGMAIVQQVEVPCESAYQQGEQEKRPLTWLRIAWVPCGKPNCLTFNDLNHCVGWGCGEWKWRERRVRF